MRAYQFTFLLILSLLSSCVSTPKKLPPIPTSTQDKKLFLRAKKLYKNKRYTMAQDLLKKLVARSQNTFESNYSYILLGDIEQSRNNHQKAADYYLHVINGKVTSRKEGEAYLKAVSSLHNSGKIEEALSLITKGFNSFLTTKKEKHLLLKLRAKYHTNLGDHFQALKAYIRLAKNFPNKRVYKVAAQNIVETRLNIKELKVVSRLQGSSSLVFHALYKLGLHYLNEGENSSATYYLQQALSENPDHSLSQRIRSLLEQINAQEKVSSQTIGVILPLYKKHSYVAKKVLHGLQLGLGIFGKNTSQFRLAVIDSEANPDTARRGVEKLVKEDHVIAIVGGLLAKTSLAIAEKSQQLGVPNIALSQKSELTQIGDYIFRNALTSRMQVRKLVKISMKQEKIKRFAILYPNDAYGKEFSRLFWDEVEAQGGKVTAAQFYNSKSTNFSDSVRKLIGTFHIKDRADEYNLRLKKWQESNQKKGQRRNKQPENLLPPIVRFEAIFIPDVTKAVRQIAPMIAYHNVKGLTLLGTNLWNSSSFVKNEQRYIEKAIFTDDSLSKKKLLKRTAFYREYLNTFGSEPSALAARAYDTGIILRQLISSGETSRSGLKNQLLNAQPFQGINGKISISSSREFLYPVIGLTISKGKVKEIPDNNVSGF